MPADYSGRIQGHPILPGLSNNTYWDALTEFSFIPAGSGQQFAGGCFYDTSYVDLYATSAIGCSYNIHNIMSRLAKALTLV